MFVLIALMSLAGFAIAFYVYETTRVHGKMICFLGHDCKAVVESKYGKLFYVRNEMWGMIAYIIIFFAAIFAEVSTGDAALIFHMMLILTVIPATVFSLMLTYIQFTLLKKYCFWCMAANLINFMLFILIM